MRKSILVLMIAIGLGLTTTDQLRAETGNFSLTLGAKTLNEDDWATNDDQFEIGLEADFAVSGLPCNLAVGLSGSGADNTFYTYENGYLSSVRDEVTTTELRFGLKQIWRAGPTLRGFLAGGPAIIAASEEFRYNDGYTHIYTYGYRDYYYVAEYEGLSISDDGISLGVWAATGLYLSLENRLNVGFSIGYSAGRVRLFGDKVDAGGGHLGLLLGFSF